MRTPSPKERVNAAGILIMVWSSAKPNHVQRRVLEVIDRPNRVMKLHCFAGKKRGAFQAYKFQASLIVSSAISASRREGYLVSGACFQAHNKSSAWPEWMGRPLWDLAWCGFVPKSLTDQFHDGNKSAEVL